MSLIVLISPNGQTRQIALSKTQPLSIGRHAISDIQIDHGSVGMLHARISWAKRHYELTAAGDAPIDVNGKKVRQADLKVGDVMKIGDCELLFTSQEALEAAAIDAAKLAAGRNLDVRLQEISEEIPVWHRPPSDKPRTTPPPSKPAPPKETKKDKPKEKPAKRIEADDKLEVISQPEIIIEDILDPPSEAKADVVIPRAGTLGTKPAVVEADSPLKTIRDALYASRQRPGQQELRRSPLALGLSIGGIVLLLGAIIFWFLIGMEESKRYLEAARAEYEQGKFVQAIQRYEDFLTLFPGDQNAEAARQELSRARVRKEIDSSAPDWSAGLNELRKLIERHRDDIGFIGMHPDIVVDARKIANGACATADRLHDPALFPVSEEAAKIVERYLDDESLLKTALEEIRQSRRKAEASLIKHAAFVDGVAQIEKELKESRALDAMQTRRDLQLRYPEFRSDAKLGKLLQSAIETERALVKVLEERIETGDVRVGQSPPGLSLNANTRPRTDEPRAERTVYLHSADALFGVDTGNGDPIWKRIVGTELPFFPIEIPLEVEAILLQNGETGELECLNRNTGEVVWIQPHVGRVSGAPLIVDGQAFFATRAGELHQVDLETGTILSRLAFSQPLESSPALIGDQDRLIVVGEREVVYLLNLRPLEIQTVVPIGHARGSIPVAPLRMGPLVLLNENDRANSCLLQVYDTRDKSKPLVRIAEHRVNGVVKDPPAIRGRQLAVSSWPERVTAFTVSAETDQPALVLVAETQVAGARPTSAWLETGPDGQIWMSSTAVRKLKLSTDSLEIDSNFTATGIASQPPQMLGEQLFVARRTADSSSVRFSRVSRDTFSGYWRTTFGDTIRETTTNSAGELVALTDSGEVYRLKTPQLEAGGPLLRSNVSLEYPAASTRPLITATLSDGRLIAVTSGTQPTLFVIRQTAQVQSQTSLSENLEAPPIDLGNTLVLPYAGRLSGVRGTGPAIQDFLAPVEAGEEVHWKYVVKVSDDECLAFDRGGKVIRVQLREQPVPNLSQAGEAKLEHPPVAPPVAVGEGVFALATADNKLHLFDAKLLQSTDERELKSSLVSGPWVIGQSVFIETEFEGLLCLDAAKQLEIRWAVALNDGRLAGRPTQIGDDLYCPLNDGRVLVVNPVDGVVKRTLAARQRLAGHPVVFEDKLFLPTAAGSLLPVSALPEPIP